MKNLLRCLKYLVAKLIFLGSRMEGADIEIKLRLVPEVLLSCSVIRNVDLDFKRRFTLIVSKLRIKAIRLYS